MRFLVKLFDTTQEAADESLIPREQVEEYLMSEDYKNIITKRLSVGGVTHKDRRLDPEYGELIGPDDLTFVNDNITHYITKIFLKDNDNFVYAIAETFDPELFSGLRRDNIINVIGMLKSGVLPPISIVIQALWDTREVCRKIIRIKGFDITWSPSFKGAGVEKVFGAGNFKDGDNVPEGHKVFSDSQVANAFEGCKMVTRTFSSASITQIDDSDDQHISDGVISGENPSQTVSGLDQRAVDLLEDAQIEADKAYSRRDIIQKFGLNSEIAIKTRSFSFVPKEVVDDYLKEKMNEIDQRIESGVIEQVDPEATPTVPDAKRDYEVDEMVELIYEIIGSNDPKLTESCFHGGRQKLMQIMLSVPKNEPNRKGMLKVKLDEFFRNTPRTAEFSTINSVKDRVLLERYPRYSLINRLVKSYKHYYENNKESLSESEFGLLKSLFVNDLNLLIKKVQDRIYKGSTLNSLFALVQFNPEIAQIGARLSKVYRQVIIAERMLGFIPAGKYKEWREVLHEFYNEFSKYAFGVPYDQEVVILDKLD